MLMKKCPKCELNYITEPNATLCSVCSKDSKPSTTPTKIDSNKYIVENDLVPLLKKFNQKALDHFSTKEYSYRVLRLRLPLLKPCLDLGKEHCKIEVALGSSSVYRYYIEPYVLNGKKYHICSQWADCIGNESKRVLMILKEIKDDIQ